MMSGKPRNADLIKLDDVPALLLELTGVTRCRATVYKWSRYGRINYLSTNIKLKTTRRLGTYYTCRRWVLEFIEQIG